MKVAVFAYSRQGCKTARKVMGYFSGDEVLTPWSGRGTRFRAIERPSSPLRAHLRLV